MRHAVVQRAVVLLHMSDAFARKLFDPATKTVRGLADDELALLRTMDARAFRTDPERPLRLIAALLEEYPVSSAIVGASQLPAFIATSVFENAVLHDRLIADAFGDWLFARAGAVTHIELAIAMARRRRRRRGTGIVRAPGVEVARVPAGTLAFYAHALATLGAQAKTAHEAVAHGARVEAPAEVRDLEQILVDASGVSTCADELFALLSFAREGMPRDTVIEEARRLGADDDAASLVDDLVRDGLLADV